MSETLSGHFEVTAVAGTKVKAFVPDPLPPKGLQLGPVTLRALDKATLALGVLKGTAAALPHASFLLYSFVRREAVLSSQIEGTQSSLAQLMTHEAQGDPGAPLDDLRETSRAVAAIEHGVKRMAGGFPLSVRLVKEMHALLMGDSGSAASLTPGELRRSQNWVGGSRPDLATHVPPPPHLVADCLSKWEAYLHHDEPLGVVAKAALAHVQFESIHPFLDGNGRLGRALVSLMLVQDKALDAPWLYLSLYLRQHRQSYYQRLNEVRHVAGWEPWIRFFAAALQATAEDATATALSLRALAEKDRDRILDRGTRQAACILVHEALCQRPILSIKQACQETGLVVNGVTNALGVLRELGMVKELTGNKRGRVYAYRAALAILNKGTEA